MNYDDLDPGIRDTVKMLNERGWATTDSGDGTSKPADERVFNVPHVVCRVQPVLNICKEADRLQDVLGDRWRVEASYAPKDGVGLLLAFGQAEP